MFLFLFQPNETVEMLKMKIEGKVQIQLNQQQIVDGENPHVILAGKCQECNLEDEGSRTLGYWNLSNGALLKLYKMTPVKPRATAVTSKLQAHQLSRIFIKTLTGRTIECKVKVKYLQIFD